MKTPTCSYYEEKGKTCHKYWPAAIWPDISAKSVLESNIGNSTYRKMSNVAIFQVLLDLNNSSSSKKKTTICKKCKF